MALKKLKMSSLEAKRRSDRNWYARHKDDPDFMEHQRETKRAYYQRNKARENDKSLARYYRKKYNHGKEIVWYVNDVAQLFKITINEARLLGKLLNVPKPFGHYIFTRRYINMIKWIIRYREASETVKE